MSGRKVPAFIAAGVFFSWIGYLTWLAVPLIGTRPVVLSRAQWLNAPLAILAQVEADPSGQPVEMVEVREVLHGSGPAAGQKVKVLFLPEAAGFTGTGEYLLLLRPRGEMVQIAPLPRSPGLNPQSRPVIYAWTESVRRQWQQLQALR